KEWIKIGIAAIFEVFWVIGLKYATNIWAWSLTIVSIVISFYLLIMAGKKLPASTAYAVFVGLGTAGTVLADILFFDEPFMLLKIVFIALLLIGVIGLQLMTEEKMSEGAE